MKVNELKPYQKKISLLVKIASTGEVREVVARLDNSLHKVAEALAGDETASIMLTLWDGEIDRAEKGKTYGIENAYTTVFRNSIRLNVGKYGKMEESGQQIGEVNVENNLSEKELGP